MNYSTAIFLISDEARAMMLSYEDHEGAKRTLFKTLDPKIKVDDYVTVPTDTRHEMTVCKVMEVDVEPDFDTTDKVEWIIGVVDRVNFEQIEAQENAAIATIKKAENKRRRAELRLDLIVDADELPAIGFTAKTDD